ncbi:helix-turn-helix domain-containing protein [Acidovorax sp.]|uniref:helix-turn-helix domain-containing protein n=1 Tax=Acidovorax sp. TaxID=1872122 RepID=UPI00391A744E
MGNHPCKPFLRGRAINGRTVLAGRPVEACSEIEAVIAISAVRRGSTLKSQRSFRFLALSPIHAVKSKPKLRFMKKIPIQSVAAFGQVVRAVRKAGGVRQDDVAGSVGVSHVYLRDLEHGKETAQMGRALQVLAELGIHMELEIPDEAFERLQSDAARLAAKEATVEQQPAQSQAPRRATTKRKSQDEGGNP